MSVRHYHLKGWQWPQQQPYVGRQCGGPAADYMQRSAN